MEVDMVPFESPPPPSHFPVSCDFSIFFAPPLCLHFGLCLFLGCSLGVVPQVLCACQILWSYYHSLYLCSSILCRYHIPCSSHPFLRIARFSHDSHVWYLVPGRLCTPFPI